MAYEPHPTVVVAEDDDCLRSFFDELLTENGYDCRAFSTCSEALEYVSTTGMSPDVILSDINMPGMTGLQFLHRIRNAGRDIPFILVSGSYELHSALDAMENGAADY